MINLKDILGLNPYISELDQFLTNFNQQTQKTSSSQQIEIKKHQRIAHHRDQAVSIQSPKKFWDKF